MYFYVMYKYYQYLYNIGSVVSIKFCIYYSVISIDKMALCNSLMRTLWRQI